MTAGIWIVCAAYLGLVAYAAEDEGISIPLNISAIIFAVIGLIASAG